MQLMAKNQAPLLSAFQAIRGAPLDEPQWILKVNALMVPPHYSRIVRLIQTAMTREDHFQKTNRYYSTANNLLYTGLSAEQRINIIDFIGKRTQALSAARDKIDSGQLNALRTIVDREQEANKEALLQSEMKKIGKKSNYIARNWRRSTKPWPREIRACPIGVGTPRP
jgi:hypothetical protein